MTCGSGEEADKLSELLVEQRLAACVNITGVDSVYRWQGNIEKAGEKLLIIKTAESKFGLLEQFVKENHSYECPEIIAFEVKAGSADYLNWIKSEISQID